MKHGLILAVFTFAISLCNAQGISSHFSDYKVSADIDSISFSTLTEEEKIFAAKIASFLDNRARMTLFTSLAKADSNNFSGHEWSVLTRVYVVNDTAYIPFTIGFFAGMGVAIKLVDDKFSVSYVQSADNDHVFGWSNTDSILRTDIEVPAIQQRLVLEKKPDFKNGEVIFGHLDAAFPSFFEKKGRQLVERKYHVSLTFRCTLIVVGNIKKN